MCLNAELDDLWSFDVDIGAKSRYSNRRGRWDAFPDEYARPTVLIFVIQKAQQEINQFIVAIPCEPLGGHLSGPFGPLFTRFFSFSPFSLYLAYSVLRYEESMLSRSCINPVVMRHVLAELSLCGIDTSMLCRGMGVSGDALHDPHFFLSSRQAGLMLRRALKSFQYPGMGNVIGQRRSIVSSGLLGLGILASANLREAFGLIAQFPWAFGTLLDVHISATAQGGAAVMGRANVHVDPSIEAFSVDELFASLLTICRAFAGGRAGVESVSLCYSEPPHAAQMRGFFCCPVLFGQSDHAFILGEETLALGNEAADAFVVRAVVHELTKVNDRNNISDLCETVRRILISSLPDIPNMAQIGHMLHTSERTLRRRFDDEDTNYQQLIDDVRREKAISLLKSSALSIEAMAIELGFSDVRNFRRAFHRWTGRAPTALRKQAA